MQVREQYVVLDADDLEATAAFWARLLDGQVEGDADWKDVRREGRTLICVQHAPGLVPPDWPDGAPQQVHLDLVVDAIEPAHAEAVAAGARVLKAPEPADEHGFAVYADPAGHPFCLCW